MSDFTENSNMCACDNTVSEKTCLNENNRSSVSPVNDTDVVLEQFPSNPEFKNIGNDILNLDISAWTSIYIPVIPPNLHLSNHNGVTNKFHPKYLKTFIEHNLNLGKVKRIDFVDRNIDSSPITVKGAFVHFDHWYDSNESKYLRHMLDTKQKYKGKGYVYNDKLCTFYTRDETGATHSAYLTYKINYKPIEEADYDVNVHQLKAVIKRFEQDKVESDRKINELMARIEELENKK
jgi:hypothetical protein|tara:strand:+ start:538 stop:1242 length:705 start_codon:yes stop_codon:yes gene_type:complete